MVQFDEVIYPCLWDVKADWGWFSRNSTFRISPIIVSRVFGHKFLQRTQNQKAFYTWNDALVLKNCEQECCFNHLVLPVQSGLFPSCIPQILLILPDISEIPLCETSAPTAVRDCMFFLKFFAFPPFICQFTVHGAWMPLPLTYETIIWIFYHLTLCEPLFFLLH